MTLNGRPNSSERVGPIKIVILPPYVNWDATDDVGVSTLQFAGFTAQGHYSHALKLGQRLLDARPGQPQLTLWVAQLRRYLTEGR